jgi:hypothetical protein
MTKLAAGATIVLTLFLLFIVPPRNRAARIDGAPRVANSNGPSFTTFDCPGAGTAPLQGTGGISINSAATITGLCVLAGSGNVAHGFVRAADGTITLFDAPGAGTGKNEGTFPTGINSGGVITGMVDDTKSVYHGFVRAADGTFTEFDAPGANLSLDAGTIPMSINTAGTITGMYRDPSLVYHGFVRTAGGTISTFDAPGAGTGYVQGTQPLSINTTGTITGFYRDTNYVEHGFVRATNGTFTVIDAPGAGTTPGQFKGFKFQGTNAVSINAGGVIAASGRTRALPITVSSAPPTARSASSTFLGREARARSELSPEASTRRE